MSKTYSNIPTVKDRTKLMSIEDADAHGSSHGTYRKSKNEFGTLVPGFWAKFAQFFGNLLEIPGAILWESGGGVRENLPRI